jgi:abortive infection bacteriophage resistance protein
MRTTSGRLILRGIQMSELKKQQPSMTIVEQIANLRENGMIIEDEDFAKDLLNDVSYFRLIKAYSLGLKDKNGNYHDNVRFEDVVNL